MIYYIFFGIVANLLACLIIWGTQELESTEGRIPKRHSCPPKEQGGLPILYCQDMFVFMIGDLIGLTLVNSALFYYFSQVPLTSQMLLAVLPVFLFDAAYLYIQQAMPGHRPDAGAPGNGRLSITGWAHLVYHGYFASLTIAFVVMQYLQGAEVLSIALFMTGGAIWLGAAVFDSYRGIFRSVSVHQLKVSRSKALKKVPVQAKIARTGD